MQVTFLRATEPAVPCTKSYKKQDDIITSEPYPFITKFSSLNHDITTIEEFANRIEGHSKAGDVLLKGHINRQLDNESRRGSTHKTDSTRWICLDIDGYRSITEPAHFIESILPAEFQNCSYIWQPSASAGILSRGLSGHLFFLLEDDQPAPLLKQWMTWINLTVDALKNELALAKTGVTLTYRLDITSCQNDRLIYIAPPMLEGIEDPIPKRINLTSKERETVALDLTSLNLLSLQEMIDEKVNELRKNQGLSKRTAKYKIYGNEEILTNPTRGTVTGTKFEGEFTRLNLNGGTRWSYWFWTNKPDLLYNFKGEPIMQLRDIDPAYYASLIAQDENTQPLIFRDLRTDQYYNGFHHKAENRVEIYPAGSKDKLADFMSNTGGSIPESIPDWSVEFNPPSGYLIDYKKRNLNLYQKSEILKQVISPCNSVPPTIQKWIMHVVGNDLDSFNRLMHWLAYIVQFKRKPQTAWIVHGTTGTGKGVMFSKILSPVLGPEYCVMKKLVDFEDKFNGFMERSLLVFVDEAAISTVRNSDLVEELLKNMVTEEQMDIRQMRISGYQRNTYFGTILASNKHESVPIRPNDRRYHVAPRQEQQIIWTPEIEIMIAEELVDFASYLTHLKINLDWVKKPAWNNAKKALMEASTTSVDGFFDALKAGNFSYFWRCYEDEIISGDAVKASQTKMIVERWFHSIGEEIVIRRDELLAVYSYVQGANSSVNKIDRMLAMRGMKFDIHKTAEGIKSGVKITWQLDPELHTFFKQTLEQKNEQRAFH